MSRKVCVITGTRAEYGLLRWVMQGIKDTSGLELQIIVTGAHLSTQFGNTYRDIEEDGFHINQKVDMQLSSDTPVGITRSMGQGMISFADALNELKPDILVVLGDRFEILPAVSAALVARIPVAHLHGGETTEGAIDEAIRHSITKMSHLHFVANDEYRRRVIQLGEQPEHVYMVGGLGVDSIKKLKLLSKDELESSLDFQFRKNNLLITFHPVTLEDNTALVQVEELLKALEDLKDTGLIFTMPNADTDGRIVFMKIEQFVSTHENTRVFTSLGQLRYLSCIKYVDAVVGNSSSGLAEVPSFNKGTINIGDRQKGRLKAASVIDCMPEHESIRSALRKLYSTEFQDCLADVVNPYGDGGASEKIVTMLSDYPLEGILKKSFYDLDFDSSGECK